MPPPVDKKREQQPVKQPESTRSAPPDTTPYVRPAVPEDYSPGGKNPNPPPVEKKEGADKESEPAKSDNSKTEDK
jgi:hypothetical protein